MKFTTSSNLKRHQRHKQAFEKPFECTDCEMKFATCTQLKRHQRYKDTLKNCMIVLIMIVSWLKVLH